MLSRPLNSWRTRSVTALLAGLVFGTVSGKGRAGEAEPWLELFNGRNLDGWRAAEHPGSFKVADGTIVAQGERGHLFYAGPDGKADFRNFEATVEVLSAPGANSGFYFHTRFQEKDWPSAGFEVQINNSQPRHGGYLELKKTASLYGLRNQYKSLVRDNEWFRLSLAVQSHRVRIRVNDVLVVDYVEPTPESAEGTAAGKRIGHGTFALQAHDPESRAQFRNIRVRRLPDDEAGAAPVVWDALDRQVAALSGENFPVVDLHGHLKGGLTLEELLAWSRRTGIFYGVAVNCGLGFGVTNDAGAEAFLETVRGQPVFAGMQAEGREWVTLFTPATLAKFDYVFTDSMTWTDDRGRRMRLWIKDEVEVGDPQSFMETLVRRIEGIFDHEPIDLYVNPTYLPDVLAADYERLWTPERMSRVITAAKRNGIALEINSRFRLPSRTFILQAKAAGLKFTLGTNNGDRDLGRLEYSLQMVKECGLGWENMWVPGPDARSKRWIK